MKKLSVIMITMIAALVMLLPLSASAVRADEDGSSYSALASVDLVGSGTEADPYLIQDENDLSVLAEYINSGRGSGLRKYFSQTMDINLSGISKWTPIGKSSQVFSGVYQGNGHKITGMYVEGTDYLGLFGCIAEAELYDINIRGQIKVTDGTGLTGYRHVGGIVGCVGKYVSSDQSDPETCIISGCVSDVEIVSSKTGNGGIAGVIENDAQIINCMNYGDIVLSETGNFYAGGASGGIVGYFAADGVITGCVNHGDIINSGTGDTSMGGITGEAQSSSDLTISYCYNTGTISTNGTFTSVGAGGIIGRRTNWYDENSTNIDPYDVRILYCYNVGPVSAENRSDCSAGGIAGRVLSVNSYGDPIVTDDNTSHVYSLDTSSAFLMGNENGTEVARGLADVSDFTESQSSREGIPWLLKQLGSEYFKDDANFVNAGFPLLFWEDPGESLGDDVGKVAFDIDYDDRVNLSSDRTVTIVLDGETVDGKTFILKAGKHTYSISLDGYETATGSFTVTAQLDTLQSVYVELKAISYIWTFNVSPADAHLSVTDSSGKELSPSESSEGVYKYSLYNGAYIAAASMDGCYDAIVSFNVSFKKGSRDLVCEEIPETAPVEPAKDAEGYYLIYTPQELEWINVQATSVDQDSANEMAEALIRLMADIDMDGYPWLVMNGTETASYLSNGYYSGGCFTGIFDGNGHIITNLVTDRINTAESSYYFSRADGVGGLFGWTKGALIKDTGLEGSIHVSDAPASGYGDFIHVGGIVGMAQSLTSISGCYAKMDITFDVTLNEHGNKVGYYYSSDTYIGGIAGSLTTGSSVTDCYSAGTLKGEGTYSVNIGGIAGSTRGDYHVYDDETNELIETIYDQIIRCYSSAVITSDPYQSGYLGGIVGLVRGSNLGDIPDIYENFALNASIDGSGKCIANRILGNSYTFEQSGYYNYALDTMSIINAQLQEEESNYANSYGLDITDANARLAATYSNIGWSSDMWKLDVVGEYPRLWFEDAANHTHDWVIKYVVDASCYDYGYTVSECSICGEEKTGSFTSPGAHQWGSWTESTERVNSHEHVCTLCGAKEVRVHTWDDGVASETGSILYTCTSCGAEKTVAGAGYHITVYDYTRGRDGLSDGDQVTDITDRYYNGEVVFNVNADSACTVALKDASDSYIILQCTSTSEGYTFDIDVTADTEIYIVVKGDTDLNGQVNSKDATLVTKCVQKTMKLSPVEQLAADISGTGTLDSKDATLIARIISGSYIAGWDEK